MTDLTPLQIHQEFCTSYSPDCFYCNVCDACKQEEAIVYDTYFEQYLCDGCQAVAVMREDYARSHR